MRRCLSNMLGRAPGLVGRPSGFLRKGTACPVDALMRTLIAWPSSDQTLFHSAGELPEVSAASCHTASLTIRSALPTAVCALSAWLLQTLRMKGPLGFADRQLRLRHAGTLQSLSSPRHDRVVHDPQPAEMVGHDISGQVVWERREERGGGSCRHTHPR